MALGFLLRFFYSFCYSCSEVWWITGIADRELRMLANRYLRCAIFEAISIC